MKNNYLLKFNRFLDCFNDALFFHDFYLLFVIWFVLILLLLLLIKVSEHIYKLGMISGVTKDSSHELNSVGEKRRRTNLFKLIHHDNPPYNLLVKRQIGVILNYFLKVIFIAIIVTLCVSFFVYFFKANIYYKMNFINYYLFNVNNFYGVYWILSGIVLGLFAYFIIYNKYIKEYFSELDRSYNEKAISIVKKSSLRSGELLDVRNLKFNDSEKYNPIDYFEGAKNNASLSLGLDDERNPIYMKKEIWDETNVQIIGKMGSGKGVLATSVLLQCYLNFNDFIIWLDPKNDEWAYSIFKKYVKENEFHYIDLSRGSKPQINIFSGINSDELNELFVAGFGLGRSGTNADFYRIGDRKACRELSNKFKNREDVNINTIMHEWELLPEKIREGAKNFYGQLEELSELECIQTSEGLNLTEIISNNDAGCLFITGSIRDENVIMLQKMLTLRCIQILEKRDRQYKLKHIDIMCDEVRYLISKSVVEAMGTIRDKKANIMFTHQSLGDLIGSGQDLDPMATKDVMIDSPTVRWIYKLDNIQSAKWASDLTSEVLKDVERRTFTLNSANVEMAGKETTIFKQKANYIETSVIQNLPKRCGVIVGLGGLAKLAYSSPIIVDKIPKVINEMPKINLSYKKVSLSNKQKKTYEKSLNNSKNADLDVLFKSEGLSSFLNKSDNNVISDISLDSNLHENNIDKDNS